MNAVADILLKRMLVRGLQVVLRREPHFVFQLLANHDREYQEQAAEFFAKNIVQVTLGPPNSVVVLPHVVMILRGEKESQAYLGGVLDYDPPEEMSYDGAVTGIEPTHLASPTDPAGPGLVIFGPKAVAEADATSVTVDESIAAGILKNQRITVHVLSGIGRGQIRAVSDNAGKKVMIGIQWDPNRTPVA